MDTLIQKLGHLDEKLKNIAAKDDINIFRKEVNALHEENKLLKSEILKLKEGEHDTG